MFTLLFAVLIVMTNMGNIPTILNIVSFLHGTMHMGIADASTTATNFFGALCVLSFLGAFISDSYIKRFYTILVFAPVQILASLYSTLFVSKLLLSLTF
jgi:solute carrier family 15 (peptide/histidine transporter), member 3/4